MRCFNIPPQIRISAAVNLVCRCLEYSLPENPHAIRLVLSIEIPLKLNLTDFLDIAMNRHSKQVLRKQRLADLHSLYLLRDTNHSLRHSVIILRRWGSKWNRWNGWGLVFLFGYFFQLWSNCPLEEVRIILCQLLHCCLSRCTDNLVLLFLPTDMKEYS